MRMISSNGYRKGYFKGFLVIETGKMDSTSYSITLREFRFLEGPYKNELFWQPSDAIVKR